MFVVCLILRADEKQTYFDNSGYKKKLPIYGAHARPPQGTVESISVLQINKLLVHNWIIYIWM